MTLSLAGTRSACGNKLTRPAGKQNTRHHARAAIITPLTTGFSLRLIVAAQVGPIWQLCMRSVLRGLLLTSAEICPGAAPIDPALATLRMAEATQMLRITPARLALGLPGVAVLLAIGGRTPVVSGPDPQQAGNSRNKAPSAHTPGATGAPAASAACGALLG